MKAREFCYWLQGWFELHNPVEIDVKRTELIRRHLNMVYIHEPQGNAFCNFLNGFLKISATDSISGQQTEVIKEELNKMFEHVAGKEPAAIKRQVRQPDDDNKVEAMC